MEDGVYAVTKSASCKTRNTLEYFEMRMPENKFFRCHRSYLVNIGKIRRLVNMVSTYDIVLEGVKKPIPLSKGRVKVLKKRLSDGMTTS
jgi:two-component system LytT family response regulator